MGKTPVLTVKDRLQSYAFSCGLLIVHYRGSITGGRISYKCVHHGEAPIDPQMLVSNPSHIPDHRGQLQFVEAAYQMEEHLAQQPAHIAAQRAREFQQAATRLHQKWSDSQANFNTTILPTASLSFRTQFCTSSGRITTTDPRKGLRRGPTGAELAECELHRQQVIVHTNQENETQDIIVVQKKS